MFSQPQPHFTAILFKPFPFSSSSLLTNKARSFSIKIPPFSLQSLPMVCNSKLQTYPSSLNDTHLAESGNLATANHATNEEIVDTEYFSPRTMADHAAEEMASIMMDNFPSPAVYAGAPNLFSGDANQAFARVRAKVKGVLYGYAFVLLAYGKLLQAHAQQAIIADGEDGQIHQQDGDALEGQ